MPEVTNEADFTWKGRLGPIPLRLSANTFPPSTISSLMAQAIEVEPDDVVFDVGCGSGILSIIAAKLGAKHVHGMDYSPDVVAVAGENAGNHGVADRVTFYQGDLFESVPDGLQADLIFGDVSGIPDALAASSGWFPSKTGGGPRGSELPIRMLGDAPKYLKPGGRLLLPTGTLQDEEAILDAARQFYGEVRMLVERMIPLPTELAESDTVQKLIEDGVVKLIPRGSRFVWEARVWECPAP